MNENKEEVFESKWDIEAREKAEAIAADRKLLKKRLNEAKSCLTTEFKHIFGATVYDFENKRIISQDGRYALQWKVREFPDKPTGYRNQQTNCGSVFVVKL